jgi:hypothetical protein
MVTFIVLAILLLIIISVLRTRIEEYHSNWSLLLPNFKFSTEKFYELVQKEMENHEISELSFNEVCLKTGNLFSHERIYLRVRWQDYHYDLCFAPFGDGCFVSWWLIFSTTEIEDILTNIPLIGILIKRAFYTQTYYKIDTASMFMTYAHHSVLAVIDEITKNTGIRLSQEERKPILKNIFAR